jgi:hypothetical protein
MRALLAASLVALTLAMASPSFAQQSDAAIATELFNAGRDAMWVGDFAAACPKLTESARLDPKVGTLAKLAECEEKLGHLATARGRWQQALNLARSTSDERAPLVETELARIDRIVPKLSLALSGAAPPGLTVRVDDVDLGPGSLGVPLPVDPGKHTVAASAPGKKAWSLVVETRSDGAVVPVAIPDLAPQETPATPTAAPAATSALPPTALPASEEKPASSSSSPLRLIGLATAGAGLVAIGVGTAFGVVAKSKLDSSNQPGGCGGPSGNDCPGSSYKTRNDARSAGNLSTAFFVVGGVLAAGGVTLWLVAPRRDAPRSARIHAAPSLGPGFAGVGLHGTWW